METNKLTTTGPVVVIGGSGKTGRRVVELLEIQGVQVRSASRSSAPAFDWTNADTWAPVLTGAKAAYVTFSPDLAVPGAPETVAQFATLATQLGVNRIVLLSGRGEAEALRAEQLVFDAAKEVTIVRASWFNQNFSEGFWVDEVASGVLALPETSVREPFVDANDIAEVAVKALLEPGHAGKVYELTGPELLTFAEALEKISTAAGRSIELVALPADVYFAAAREQGLPEEVIELFSYLFSEVLDGRNEVLATGVFEALGREPISFDTFAKAAASTGVWSTKDES